jgi:hypothetical protein
MKCTGCLINVALVALEAAENRAAEEAVAHSNDARADATRIRTLEKRLAEAEEGVKVERALSERLATAMRNQLARWNDVTMIEMRDVLDEYDEVRKATGL